MIITMYSSIGIYDASHIVCVIPGVSYYTSIWLNSSFCSLCVFSAEDLNPIIHQTKFFFFLYLFFKDTSHHLEFKRLKKCETKLEPLLFCQEKLFLCVSPPPPHPILPVVCGCSSQGSEEQSSNASWINMAWGRVCVCVCFSLQTIEISCERLSEMLQ